MRATSRWRNWSLILLLAVLTQTKCLAASTLVTEEQSPKLLLPLGHTGAVFSVALSADGKRALTGSWDKTAILWDAESGNLLQTLREHDQVVTGVAFGSGN